MGAFARIQQALSLLPLPRPAAAAIDRPRVRSAYMRDGRGMLFGQWRPFLRSAQDDVANALDQATARTIELVQNTGWISGMIDQATANTVGMGLRLRAQPENELFGMDEAAAQEWRKRVMARWDLWANNRLECDIEGTRTIPEMQEAAFKTWIATGEIVGEIVMRSRPESASKTKVRLVSPTRLINRTDETTGLYAGVRVNGDGLPISYLAKRRHPFFGDQEIEVSARDPYGRPRVIHVFTGMPGQRRGITILVPVLKVAKQFDQLSDATLTAAIIQTVFAAAITSDSPTEEALRSLLSPAEQAKLIASGGSAFDAWFEAQAGWSDGHPIDVGFAGRVAHMFPGEKLDFLSPEMPASSYKEFSIQLLREMARCLGLTYESATGDYEGATYSSVRMAVNEIYTITKARRRFVLAPFLQPIYEAWLEEEIFAGTTPFPGGPDNFLRNRAAACRASWAGMPKPVADDLKAAKSHEVYRNMGIMSDSMIADDLGVEIEDVYADRAREAELRRKYDLPDNFYPSALTATEQIDAMPDNPPAGGGGA